MKILGKSSKEKYLVEMTITEMAIASSHSKSSYSDIDVITEKDLKERIDIRELKPGMIVDISDNFDKSREVFDSYEELKKNISSIKSSCTKFINAIND